MRILFPAHQDGASGIGTVVRGLSSSLPAALSPSDELVIVGGAADRRQAPNVRRVELNGDASTRLRRALHEQGRLARMARDVDLVHLCDHRPLLLARTPFLLTVHDVFFLDRPDWFPRGVAAYKKAMLAAALRKAPATIVCDSCYTLERLLMHFPAAARSDVRVIHPGVAAAPDADEPAAEEEGYFLTVSTIEPRKNHLGLLRAFERARRTRPFDLRWKVVGAPGYRSKGIVAALHAADGVDVLGRVSQKDLERLYRRARFVAVPSHAEGFGYPPLEAMARGVPVVCASGSAMEETAGTACLRVPADDIAAWADALETLAFDEHLRSGLRALGLARAREFTWERAAVAYVEAYGDALAA